MKHLGEKIHDLRVDNDLTQEKLAAEFKILKTTWCQYEKGKRQPDINMLKDIADYFKVSLDYILDTTKYEYDPKDKSFKDLMECYMEALRKGNEKELIKYIKDFKKEL